jgi:hypothetical protein
VNDKYDGRQQFTSMQGDIFALSLIAMICVSIAAMKLRGTRPSPRKILGGAILAVVTFIFFMLLLAGDGCYRGHAMGPIIFGPLFVGAVCATVRKKKYIFMIWMLWFALDIWGGFLCHSDGYVGNPNYEKYWPDKTSASELIDAQDNIRNASPDKKSLILAQGWLEESWRIAAAEEYPGPAQWPSVTVGRCWHTWLTGVFSLQSHNCGIWCPGGSMESCIEKLDIRTRSD